MTSRRKPLGAKRPFNWYHIIVTRKSRNSIVSEDNLRSVLDYLRYYGVIDDWYTFHSSHESKYRDLHMHIIGRYNGYYAYLTKQYPGYNIRFKKIPSKNPLALTRRIVNILRYIYRGEKDYDIFTSRQLDINYYTYIYRP